MSDSTIGNDVQFDDDNGENAFLANLTGEDPRKQASTATDDNGTDQGEKETSAKTETESDEADQGTEGDEPEAAEEGEADPDDQEFEIKVGDQTVKQTLKELKRLAGQEAALTQKSQKLAESQRATDGRFQMATTALTKLLEKAQAHADQYATLDFLSLTAQVGAGQLDQATFDALRMDAKAADDQVKFLKEELGTLVQTQQQESAQAHRLAANECIKVLSDEQTGIKGWGKPMYDELTAFAQQHNVHQAFAQSTDPNVIKLMHMAMQWSKAEAARKAAEKKVQAAPNKPTKVLRPGTSKVTSQGKAVEALKTLRRNGDVDSATDAFLASFS
jgi:hypothetical protein